jgi:outer membrane cobalamin receptor
VQLKDYGGVGGLKTVNIRSLGTNHVGVFYDGIAIGNAQNGQVDMGRFSLDNMEAVSLYNGQKSTLLQPARDFASASAIYMTARKPVFNDNENNHVRFTYKTGSFDAINPSALWERKWSERIHSSVNVEQLYTSGKYKFRYAKKDGYDTTEVRRNGDVTSLRTEAALFGKIMDGEWQIKGYFYNSERGYPGAAVKKDYGISLLNEDRQKDRNFFVQSLFRKNISPVYTLKLQAKYANDYMNYIMPPESTLEPMDNHYWQQEVYFTAANLFTITKHWTANLAGDFQWNCLNADGTDMFNANFVEPRRYSILGAAATSLRLNRLNLQGSLLYTFVKDVSARGMHVAPNKNVLTPAVIAAYKPFAEADFELRAFYKKIFRMPTFNDLYYVQIGNRLLNPEYVTQYNLGFFYSKVFHDKVFRSIVLQADAYYNEVTDKIIATPTSNQMVWTMINLGYVEIRGIDVAVNPSFNVGKTFVNVRLNYTYQKAQDFTPGKNKGGNGDNDHTINVYGHQIPYIPWHSGSAIVNIDYHMWNFNYSYIYTGERYMLGANIPENYILPWYTHDLSLSRAVNIKTAVLKIAAELNNVFNQQYEVVKWYPMPGTNFKITLTFII